MVYPHHIAFEYVAQEIMARLAEYKAHWDPVAKEHQVKLTLHCGIGAGEIHGYCVGANDRWE